MKKVLLALTAVLGLSAFALFTASCGGGGGGGSDDYEAPVTENGGGAEPASVSNGITGSEVFIAGRTVEIWANWCSDHEVTQEEYQAVMGIHPSLLTSPASGETQEKRPVQNVSWYDAIMYCNMRSSNENKTPCYSVNGNTDTSQWNYTPHADNSISEAITCDFSANGYRLPTEAEWEYLARGGNTSNVGQYTYSGSDTVDDVAWYRDNCENKDHEVKQKLPNAMGLYDMSGNVFEWCWDWYGTIDTGTPSTGASSGSKRIGRGGGYVSPASIACVAHRSSLEPYRRGRNLGFRVVRSAE